MSKNPDELRRRLDSLLAERQSNQDKISNLDKRTTAINKEVEEINAALATQEPEIPTITDHALIRFIERRYSLDIEAIKQEILPSDPNVMRAMKTLGKGTFPVNDSHRIVLKGNTIVSVLPLKD
jgi:chromosome segregation ATPase